MLRRDPRASLLVALSFAAMLGVLAALLAQVDHPYPGFFFSSDFRVFPVSPESRAAGLAYADRIVSADGRPPTEMMARVAAAHRPIHYEVERAGRRLSVDLAPARFTWGVLADHFAAYFVVSAAML